MSRRCSVLCGAGRTFLRREGGAAQQWKLVDGLGLGHGSRLFVCLTSSHLSLHTYIIGTLCTLWYMVMYLLAYQPAYSRTALRLKRRKIKNSETTNFSPFAFRCLNPDKNPPIRSSSSSLHLVPPASPTYS